jgi:4-amino-4-deoxy-L-arabinose transferase-like glycosyltransferase
MTRLLARVLAPHRPVTGLVLLVVLLYLPCVWTRDLWSPDEPRYAEVARAMQARGDWLLPHLNGEVYGEKPPLFFWLGLAAGELPFVPPGSGARLVSVLAALGTLLLTWRLGRRLMGPETAWLAALVLATSAMFVLHATSGVIDATLTLLVTAAVSVGLRAREERSPVLWAIFYVLAGLGLMTKGPVALAVPGGVLLVLALRESGARRAWARHPLWGIPLAAAVVALWLVPAIARGGESYADIILFKQNLGRAYDSWHHKEPITYFLRVFPPSFAPWILALPLALVSAWRARRDDPGVAPPLVWFLFTFIFFSVVSGKKTRYLLPLFPAASLLVARDLTRHAARPGRRAVVALLLVLAAAASLALIAAGLGGAEQALDRVRGLTADQRAELAWLTGMPGGLLMVVPGLLGAVFAVQGGLRLRRDPRGGLAAAATCWLVLLGWTQWVAVPALNVIKSPRALAAAAAAAASEVPGGAPIVLYRDAHSHIFNFYVGRDAIPKMTDAARTGAWLRENPGAVVIASEPDLARLEALAPDLRRVTCRRMGEEVVCVARRPIGTLRAR